MVEYTIIHYITLWLYEYHVIGNVNLLVTDITVKRKNVTIYQNDGNMMYFHNQLSFHF